MDRPRPGRIQGGLLDAFAEGRVGVGEDAEVLGAGAELDAHHETLAVLDALEHAGQDGLHAFENGLPVVQGGVARIDAERPERNDFRGLPAAFAVIHR